MIGKEDRHLQIIEQNLNINEQLKLKSGLFKGQLYCQMPWRHAILRLTALYAHLR